MATTRIMPLHIGKGRTESQAISDIIDYVANPQKTDNGKLITGYGCDSRTADAEFLPAKLVHAAITTLGALCVSLSAVPVANAFALWYDGFKKSSVCGGFLWQDVFVRIRKPPGSKRVIFHEGNHT